MTNGSTSNLDYPMNIKTILFTTLALTIASPVLADAAPKLCYFQAGTKLPSIVGMTVTASRAKDTDRTRAVSDIVQGFSDLQKGAAEINAKFNFMNGTLDEATRYPHSKGGGIERVQAQLIQALADSTSGAAEVEIDVRAVAQDGTFSYWCIWNRSTGGVHVVSRGLK